MAFTWVAVYKDGSLFHQYDQNGAERSSEHIDRKKLLSFVLYDHDNRPLLTQNLDPGHRLIYRRRVEQSPGGDAIVCHLVGWQQTVYTQDGHPRNVQHISYVFEADRRIVMGGRWRSDHRWFYPVTTVPAEDVAVE